MIINDICTYLDTELDTLTAETNLFKTFMPDSPTTCVCIYDTGGATPSRDIPDGLPTFQVIVRSSDYETGKNLIDSIVDKLHQKRSSELVSGETFFYWIYLMGEAGHIGLDKKERDQFSVNFETRIRR